jgi:hypothetical protein
MRCYFCSSNETIVNDVSVGRVVLCLECGANHLQLDDVISS